MNEIEVSAKKVEDAINEGLRELNTTIDNVSIEILSQGGFLKKAKIRMRVNTPEQKSQPKPEQKSQPKPEQKPQPKLEQKPQPKPEQKPQPKPEQKPQPKPEQKPQPKPEQKPQPKLEQKPQPKLEQQIAVVEQTTNEPKLEKTLPPEAKIVAEDFLKGMFERMGIAVDIEIEADTELNINLISDEVKLIGYKGETLDAISCFVATIVKNKLKTYVAVNVDNNDYHKERDKRLVEMAHKKAERCVKLGKKVVLDPMSARDRKIVHSALGEDERIVTKSSGQEPHRRVVIYPKK